MAKMSDLVAERSKGVARAASSVRNHVPLWLGLALFWTWIWLLMTDSAHTAESVLEGRPRFSLLILLASATLVCLSTTPALSRFRNHEKLRKALGTVVALLAVSGISSYLAPLSGPAGPLLDVAAVLTNGAVLAVLFLAWGRVIMNLQPEEQAPCCAASFLAASLMGNVFQRICGDPSLWLASFVPPLASILLMVPCLSSRKPLPSRDESDGTCYEAPPHGKLLVTLFLSGVAFGAYFPCRGMIYAGYAGNGLGFLLCAAVTLVFVWMMGLDYRKVIYQVGFTLAASGFALLIVDLWVYGGEMGRPVSPLGLAGGALCSSGFHFIWFSAWVCCSILAKGRLAWKTRLLSKAGVTFFFGQFVGVGLLCMALSFSAGLMVLSIGLPFALMASGMFFAGGEGAAEEPPSPPTNPYRPADGWEEAIVEKIGDRYKLTPREQEVFLLLMRGRNFDYIQKKLVVSRDTVKSHARSIYRKLGIHSQQDLIDMVEDEKSETARTSNP